MTDPNSWNDEVPLSGAADVGELPLVTEVPTYPDILPDGTPTLVSGDPQGDAAFNHRQGDNPYGYQGDCGLVSAQDILNQFGVNVSEGDVVQHAIEYGECVVADDPKVAGGTTPDARAQLLRDYGVPAHVEEFGTLSGLANHIQNGQGVIVSVNAGVLWNDPRAYEQGQRNHAIVVTGVARNPTTSHIQGFYVNDSGDGQSAKFIDASSMHTAWVATGGVSVVTDRSRP